MPYSILSLPIATIRSRALVGLMAVLALSLAIPALGQTGTECDDAPASWIFCTGFEEGDLDLWDDWDGNPSSTNTLMQVVGPDGEKANTVCRLRVPPGSGTADLVKELPGSYDRLYARWYVMWEPGYDFSVSQHGSGLHAGDRSLLGRSGYRPDGDDWFGSWVEHTSDARLNTYTYYRGMYQDCGNPDGGCWGDLFPCMYDEGGWICTKPQHREDPMPPSMETGRWYCFEMMIDAGTPTTDGNNADGTINFWIDDVPYGPWDDLWLRTTSNLKLSLLWLSVYFHGSHSTEGIMLDNVVVSTEKVGPMGSGLPTEGMTWGSMKGLYR